MALRTISEIDMGGEIGNYVYEWYVVCGTWNIRLAQLKTKLETRRDTTRAFTTVR